MFHFGPEKLPGLPRNGLQAPQLGKKAKKAKKAKTTSVDDSSDKLDNDIDRIKSYPVDT